MKRLATITATFLAALSLPALADPKTVTGLDVAAYKESISTGCRFQGRRLGHPHEQIERRCKCVLATLDKRVKMEDWRKAAAFARDGKGEEEAKVLAPHNEALKACGATPKK